MPQNRRAKYELVATNLKDTTHSKDKKPITLGEFFPEELLNEFEIVPCEIKK